MKAEQLDQFIVDQHASLTYAMQKIDDNTKGIVFVIDEMHKLCGAVSDGDIRRWLIRTGEINTEVCMLMNASPKYFYTASQEDPVAYMETCSIKALPFVDDKLNIKDILLSDHVKEKRGRHCKKLDGVSVIVMAGGKGTRLYPYTKILPKPLIPIGDIPIVERIMNQFNGFGISDFLMTVNYRKNMIQSYFADADIDYSIEYVEEDKPLGTAGSIKLIKREFDKPVFVTNCDTLVRADYRDIYDFHKKSGDAITIVTAMKYDTIPYGVIQSKENGQIEKMIEKPQRSYLINTGMYIIDPEMISLIPKDSFFHMTHLTEKAIAEGYKVGMYPVSEDSFLDMGEFEEMKRMEEKLNIE